MDIDRFWLLAGRYMAGEATAEDEQELRKGLELHPEYHFRYDALKAFWGHSKQHDAIDVQKAYEIVKSSISSSEVQQKDNRSRPLVTFLLKLAAVITIGFAVGYLAYTNINFDGDWKRLTWKDKQNDKGERSKIVLSDGSTVWLNADSRLQFPQQFLGTREVYLSGEAFFDITKDSTKPFIIHLDIDSDIRVLGTSFNVKSFKDDANVETSVVSGKVAIISKKDTKQDTVFLTPNFKAILRKESGQIVKQETNTAEDKSWVDGKIIFRSSSFEEVSKVLERVYGKKVVFDSPTITNCKLTGTFQNNTLMEVMELLAATKDYQYIITEKDLHIQGTGCPPDSN